MNIIFTRHALKKLLHRSLNRRMVIATILNPEKLEVGETKYYAYKKFGKLYLKVVFKRLGNIVVVITQHFVRKIK